MLCISCDGKGILCSQFSILFYAVLSIGLWQLQGVTALSQQHACKPGDHISFAQIGRLCMNIAAAYKEGGSPEV